MAGASFSTCRAQAARALLGLVLVGVFPGACASPAEAPGPGPQAELGDRAERVARIARELIAPEAAPAREGIGVVFLIDVSRDMWTAVMDRRSSRTISSEIVIAEWAILDLVRLGAGPTPPSCRPVPECRPPSD